MDAADYSSSRQDPGNRIDDIIKINQGQKMAFTYENEFGFVVWKSKRPKGKQSAQYIFVQVRDVEPSLRKNLVFFYPMNRCKRGEMVQSDRHPDKTILQRDPSCAKLFYLLNDLDDHWKKKCIDNISSKETANRYRAERHVYDQDEQDLGDELNFLPDDARKEYRLKIVKVIVEEQGICTKDNFALVTDADHERLSIVWLLTKKQVEDMIPCDEHSSAELQAAQLGEQELICTDWPDKIELRSVQTPSSPVDVRVVLSPDQLPVSDGGEGPFCRFACKCPVTSKSGKRGEKIMFDRRWTLCEVARAGSQVGLPTKPKLADWLTDLAPCKASARPMRVRRSARRKRVCSNRFDEESILILALKAVASRLRALAS
jgi:hypothetical protein